MKLNGDASDMITLQTERRNKSYILFSHEESIKGIYSSRIQLRPFVGMGNVGLLILAETKPTSTTLSRGLSQSVSTAPSTRCWESWELGELCTGLVLLVLERGESGFVPLLIPSEALGLGV